MLPQMTLRSRSFKADSGALQNGTHGTQQG